MDTRFYSALTLHHKSGAALHPLMKRQGETWGIQLGKAFFTDDAAILRAILVEQSSVRCSNAAGDVVANYTVGKPATPTYELSPHLHRHVADAPVKPQNWASAPKPHANAALDTPLPELNGNELDRLMTPRNYLIAAAVLALLVLVVF